MFNFNTLITQVQNKDIENTKEVWKTIYRKDIVVFHNFSHTISNLDNIPAHSIIWIDKKEIENQNTILNKYPNIKKAYTEALKEKHIKGQILGILSYINGNNLSFPIVYFEKGETYTFNIDQLTEEEKLNLIIFFRFSVLVFNPYKPIIMQDNDVILDRDIRMYLLLPPSDLYKNIMFYHIQENDNIISTLLTNQLMNRLTEKPLACRHIFSEDFYLNDYPFMMNHLNIPLINQECLIYKDQYLTATDCILNVDLEKQLLGAIELEPLIVSGLMINDSYFISIKNNYYEFSPLIISFIQDSINKQQENFFKICNLNNQTKNMFIRTLCYEMGSHLLKYYSDCLNDSISPYLNTMNFINVFNIDKKNQKNQVENSHYNLVQRILHNIPDNHNYAIKAFFDDDNIFLMMVSKKTDGIAFVVLLNDQNNDQIVYDFIKVLKNKNIEYKDVPLYKFYLHMDSIKTNDIWKILEEQNNMALPEDINIINNGIDFIRSLRSYTLTDILSHSKKENKINKKILLGKIPNPEDKGIDNWKFLENPLPLIYIKNENNADDIYKKLIKEFPYFKEPSAFIAQRIALCKQFNNPFHFPPILLNGSPGIGKTRWAKRIAELCHTGYSFHSLSGIHSSMGIAGSERGWSEARPGLWAFALKKAMTANPIVVLDEVDKTTMDSRNGSPQDALLPYLEKETSSKYKDSFLMVDADISLISYIFTSNETNTLSDPLQSRMTLFQCRSPTQQEIDIIFDNIVNDICKELEIPHQNYCHNINFNEIRQAYSTHTSIRIIKREIEKTIMNTIFNVPGITDVTYKFEKNRIGFNN